MEFCLRRYKNEIEVGDGIEAALESGEVRREDLFVTTKLWSDQHAKDAVVPALKESLGKLKLSYVDLFLVHWPVTDQHGPSLQPPMQVRRLVPMHHDATSAARWTDASSSILHDHVSDYRDLRQNFPGNFKAFR